MKYNISLMADASGCRIVYIHGTPIDVFERMIPAFEMRSFLPPDTHTGRIVVDKAEINIFCNAPAGYVFRDIIKEAVEAARTEDFINSFPPAPEETK